MYSDFYRNDFSFVIDAWTDNQLFMIRHIDTSLFVSGLNALTFNQMKTFFPLYLSERLRFIIGL